MPTRSCLALTLATALALAGAGITGAEQKPATDWPQWRGPSRDGSIGAALPAEWPQTLTKRWEFTVGEGHASPVVSGNRAVVIARQGDQEIGVCRLRGCEPCTGVWRRRGGRLGDRDRPNHRLIGVEEADVGKRAGLREGHLEGGPGRVPIADDARVPEAAAIEGSGRLLGADLEDLFFTLVERADALVLGH